MCTPFFDGIHDGDFVLIVVVVKLGYDEFTLIHSDVSLARQILRIVSYLPAIPLQPR